MARITPMMMSTPRLMIARPNISALHLLPDKPGDDDQDDDKQPAGHLKPASRCRCRTSSTPSSPRAPRPPRKARTTAAEGTPSLPRCPSDKRQVQEHQDQDRQCNPDHRPHGRGARPAARRRDRVRLDHLGHADHPGGGHYAPVPYGSGTMISSQPSFTVAVPAVPVIVTVYAWAPCTELSCTENGIDVGVAAAAMVTFWVSPTWAPPRPLPCRTLTARAVPAAPRVTFRLPRMTRPCGNWPPDPASTMLTMATPSTPAPKAAVTAGSCW